ncbi:MAG: DUF4167 domain-containing protein, partial [Caldilineaceae bacterium]|nr:DUF4167 domain-containing protein [Caldilineaceae bacterium]
MKEFAAQRSETLKVRGERGNGFDGTIAGTSAHATGMRTGGAGVPQDMKFARLEKRVGMRGQNKRMRGRGGSGGGGGSGRKQPNPLTRSYESNGPDVKIRGSAQQIAEKYTTLARDAMSSGDRVVAENYLQHAE